MLTYIIYFMDTISDRFLSPSYGYYIKAEVHYSSNYGI